MTLEMRESPVVPRLTLAGDAVRRGDWNEALACADEARNEHALAHDGLRDVNARLLDAIHRRYGQAFADPFCSEVYEQTTVWYVAKVPEPASFRDAVEAVAMLWHWHMTTFRLREDRDKATFILEPCGSGGRLINEGAYYGSGKRPLSLIPSPSLTTFNEPNFPSYCTHCADHNRTFLKRGFNIMVFEGWTRAHRHGACISHVFKRLDDLPEEFYSRIGLDASEIPTTEYEPEFAERVFSDKELEALARHPVDRLRDAAAEDDSAAALALIDRSWAAWMGLHGAYRVWFTAFCNQIRDRLETVAATELIDTCAWWLVAHAVEASRELEPADAVQVWSRFWRSHGESVEVAVQDGTWTWKTPAAAVIDPELSAGWSQEQYAQVCDAITRGAENEGGADCFGTLRHEDGFFVHELHSATRR